MSKFVKSESTSKFTQLVSQVRGLDPVDIVQNYVYGVQVSNMLHYTLVIQPELGTEDDETYICLNLGVLASNGKMLYLDGSYSSVEIGYYNDTDEATMSKAYDKVMKEAKNYGLYVTSLN